MLDLATGRRLTELKNWPSSINNRPSALSPQSRIALARVSRSSNRGNAQHGYSDIKAKKSDSELVYSGRILG